MAASPPGLAMEGVAQALAPVLVASSDLELLASLTTQLTALDVELRATPKIDLPDIGYAIRRSAVVLVAGEADPVAAIRHARNVGLRWRLMVLCRKADEQVRAELVGCGVMSCCALPIADAKLKRELGRLSYLKRTAPPTGFVLDPILHTIRFGTREVRLSPREFAVVQCLIEQAGDAVSPETLYAVGWGGPHRRSDLTLMIHRLRRKLAPIGAAYDLRTLRKVGYTLAAVGQAGDLPG